MHLATKCPRSKSNRASWNVTAAARSKATSITCSKGHQTVTPWGFLHLFHFFFPFNYFSFSKHIKKIIFTCYADWYLQAHSSWQTPACRPPNAAVAATQYLKQTLCCTEPRGWWEFLGESLASGSAMWCAGSKHNSSESAKRTHDTLTTPVTPAPNEKHN